MKNPLPDIMSDATFEQLMDFGLLKPRAIRDLNIRICFKNLRNQGYSREDIFAKLQEDYPKLGNHTLRKIVYSARLPDEDAGDA